jgi:phenylalanyl-tRNA synthetase beta chain
MRVPLSWLREYVDFDFAPEELAERLTTLGFELQAIERIGADWSDVVVGELLEVRPHPSADTLSLTSVVVGDGGQPLSIVCGATNIRAGQRVPVAVPGATLPGGRTIAVSRIMGEESQGMLCSGDELGLTPDADGILILDGDTSVGQPLEQVVGDTVLDLDVKPNRGDALSIIGVAREVAGLTGGRLRWPEIRVPEEGDATADHVSVEVEDERLCSRFVARYVDGITIGESPLDIQLRLMAAGMRPVSNVVDASNYVMLEMGKPIHTFDAAAVEGGRIVVRTARAGERLETLDHVARELTPDTLLIADPRGPIGIAGVMGGASSEVSESTTAAIIESAVFDALSIRRTAQRYALRSEASSRFEKGQERRLALLGADRTAQLIAAWAGGRPAVGVVDTNPQPEATRRVMYRPARINRLLGSSLSAARMQELLARVEVAGEPANESDRVVVIEGADGLALEQGAASDEQQVALVPPHRRDIVIEADVAEEVARLYGYMEIEPRLPDTPMPDYRREPSAFVDRLRDMLAGRGLAEVLANVLIGPIDHARLGLAEGDAGTIRVVNPIATDHSEMRRSLLPGLLRVLVGNERQRRDDVAVFEIGAVHEAVDGRPVQRDQLGILLAGAWQRPSWAQPARGASVEDVKGLVEAIGQRLGVAELNYQSTPVWPMVEHPGRTALIVAGVPATEIGRVGEVDPRCLAAYGARSERAVFAVLEVEKLVELARDVAHVGYLPHLPAMERDIAVVVARDVAQSDVARAIAAEAGPLLAGLSLFDRYHGPPLDEGEVSLAYRLRFQPAEQALAENELEETMARIARRLGSELGAHVRGSETDG